MSFYSDNDSDTDDIYNTEPPVPRSIIRANRSYLHNSNRMRSLYGCNNSNTTENKFQTFISSTIGQKNYSVERLREHVTEAFEKFEKNPIISKLLSNYSDLVNYEEKLPNYDNIIDNTKSIVKNASDNFRFGPNIIVNALLGSQLIAAVKSYTAPL